MVGVLVDACGWVALMDAELNIDDALEGVVGQAELMVLESVHRELDLLSQQRKGLLLSLLESRSERILDLDGMSHPDEMLVTLSGSRRWPVLTVDRGLKERLISSGGSYIEVTSSRFLRLVET
jgi:rRNA-processing protein FCF1